MEYAVVENIRITDDKNEIDLDTVHQFLTTTYWSKDIPKEVVQKAIKHSLSVGLLLDDQLIGFGRAITDYATFAYLADIYVGAEFRGKGYSKIIIKALLDKSGSEELRRILLATADAHGLYRKFDFTNLAKPENFLEINRPKIYQQTN
ncbi:GNAT family N-acetyltransferase [Acinetobacter terrae]|uniref:GNAT family N-acetyltransferase n=1 Tax=Acinetobacter terrae TaxID=2731247 RepID=A0A4R0EGX5_9GAMM|nr:GNAT family N-acetyltransferase [Acinetobacter terrae]NNH14454.1 GNAT family N-acetyltransferase [Acinetobacter terrae]OAL88248.1 GNAT family acetyltransferase [Acinetobacter terrae]OTG78104.1 N-acetyltransferase [Acinetobacter terrae]TCB55963.1 GNAT family N-acetyltransferase [Acinetobacter terrae]